MTSDAGPDFAELARLLNDNIEALACHLLGEPTSRTRTELRFGDSGGLSVIISGARKGRWFDFTTDQGGDGIEMICAFQQLNRAGAYALGADWIKCKPNGAAADDAHKPKGAAHDDDEETAKAAKVEQIVKRIRPIYGTPGAAYLKKRGILEKALRLNCIGYNPQAWWSNETGSYGAAVFKATDNAGKIQAVHQVYLTADGEKAPLEVKKRTNGALDGAAVRFPGDCDIPDAIILCEGPETALSVWQATGRDVWACLGVSNIGKAPVPEGLEVIIARDPDEPGSQADHGLVKAAATLASRGYKVKIATPPVQYPDLKKTDFNDTLRREGEAAIVTAIWEAALYAPAPDEDEQPTGQADEDEDEQPQPATVPTIRVVAGQRHIAADQGVAAMHTAGVPFYRRDRGLVRVCLIKAKNTDGEIILVPGVMAITPAMLCRALGQSARWEKINSKGQTVRIDPPDKVVEQITGMTDEWPFPPLTGVITCPTLRPDGSLLASEGYDLATGLALYKTIPIPPIPEFPMRDDADAAILRLTDLLTEFPFVNDASKSVALSLIMTPVLRGAFPVAPMHLTNAPEAGTGKSYLADLTSAIATGERAAVISVAPSPEETETRLIGAALAGYPIIALDNVRELLQGDFLCQVTERPLLQLRRLGSSDQIRVANTFTPLANGNNATVADDLVRRTISCTLDANMESPEKRTFRTNPLAMVMRNRGSYIAAILTIARAYLAAGKPNRPTPLPSYEGWSDLIRSSLIWLGYPDPVETMEAARGADPVRQDRAGVFTAWSRELILDEPYLSFDIVEQAERRNEYTNDFVRPQLHASLLAIAVQRGTAGNKIDPRRLGIWLKKNENTIASGLKLTPDRSDYQRPRWKIIAIGK